MNTNLIHNILNVAIAATAAATAFLMATGCTTDVNGVIECSDSWIDPTISTIAVAVMGVTKSLINVARDGFGGLFKNQPPVQ